ncbi:pimeloyl-ACP methyl ester carboxylesterase [Bradyrhizobium diazoefficiens]
MSQFDASETKIHLISQARPEAAVDVVFIHGLGGHYRTTWEADKATATFWPEWIAEDIPEACVWSAQYPADPAKWLGGRGDSLPLLTVVFALLDRFDQAKLGNRPIILICHSLGGLVAKQLLRAAAERTAAKNWKVIGAAVKGVVFISTPHTGAPLSNFLATMATKLFPGVLLRPTESLKDLQANGPMLNQLSAWYRDAAHTDGIATLVYYENKPTAGVVVVPFDSADPTLLKVTPIPLSYDHWQTCKPRDRTYQAYMGAVGFIREVMSRPEPGALTLEQFREAVGKLPPGQKALLQRISKRENGVGISDLVAPGQTSKEVWYRGKDLAGTGLIEIRELSERTLVLSDGVKKLLRAHPDIVNQTLQQLD